MQRFPRILLLFLILIGAGLVTYGINRLWLGPSEYVTIENGQPYAFIEDYWNGGIKIPIKIKGVPSDYTLAVTNSSTNVWYSEKIIWKEDFENNEVDTELLLDPTYETLEGSYTIKISKLGPKEIVSQLRKTYENEENREFQLFWLTSPEDRMERTISTKKFSFPHPEVKITKPSYELIPQESSDNYLLMGISLKTKNEGSLPIFLKTVALWIDNEPVKLIWSSPPSYRAPILLTDNRLLNPGEEKRFYFDVWLSGLKAENHPVNLVLYTDTSIHPDGTILDNFSSEIVILS